MQKMNVERRTFDIADDVAANDKLRTFIDVSATKSIAKLIALSSS